MVGGVSEQGAMDDSVGVEGVFELRRQGAK